MYFVRSNTLLLCISLLYISLVPYIHGLTVTIIYIYTLVRVLSMVISIGRSWYVYSGMCSMCRGVITETMGGIAGVCCKRFKDAESDGLRSGDGWGGGRV
jgi:hypothetical protein